MSEERAVEYLRVNPMYARWAGNKVMQNPDDITPAVEELQELPPGLEGVLLSDLVTGLYVTRNLTNLNTWWWYALLLKEKEGHPDPKNWALERAKQFKLSPEELTDPS